jgi:hypothetical protein
MLSPRFLAIFPPAVAKVYIVSFRTYDDRLPSKFIVMADNMKSDINMAWGHGGSDFQSSLTNRLTYKKLNGKESLVSTTPG